jgi:signal transduction histidine kinase
VGIRPKLFLIFFLLGLAPLLVLSFALYWYGAGSLESLLRVDVENDASGIVRQVERSLQYRENEMVALAKSSGLREYIRATPAASATGADREKKDDSQERNASSIPSTVQDEIRVFLLSNPKRYLSITCLNTARQPLFRAEPVTQDSNANGPANVRFQTEVSQSSSLAADDTVWSNAEWKPVAAPLTSAAVLRYTVPIFADSPGASAPRGALIVELSGDYLFGQTSEARVNEGLSTSRSSLPPTRFVLMLDRTGEIVYHTNATYTHQPVNAVMPQFAEVARAMRSQDEGWKVYEEGNESWLVAYRVLPAVGLSVAVGGDRSSAVRGVRRLGWIALILFSLFGLVMVAVLTRVARGTARSIEKVTEGAVAIAGGKLDQRIEVRSSDETRLLAESFNIMTDRLREQIARETESRQFESFMRLSAMLTHDLKNAIASLSLLVGNMQRQFHRAEFREDAMKSLTEATNKLRALVAKLSEPVQSLSSEHQLPRPTELVGMIRRVLNATVEPVREFHQIEIKLPETLVATVEADRIEKVFENLIINALEAMGSKSGKLVVKAGPTENDEVFFLVSDTGPGMTEEFKRTKLFRAFATTKKSGVGLGLYTCREIVRTHGGHIDVESKRGSGTTFRVVLPSEPKFAGRPWKEITGRR